MVTTASESCPFCGMTDTSLRQNTGRHRPWYVVCEHCEAVGPSAENPLAAAQAWCARTSLTGNDPA